MKRNARWALACAALSAAAAAPALAGPSGAAFTTDATGSAVNQNHYGAPEDVHLNGGPPCNASRRSAHLADGDYYFRVTDPSGKRDLSVAAGSPLAQRAFTMDDGEIVASTAPTSAAVCGGLVVQVGQFAESRTGTYKLWIVPARAKGAATFPRKASKTDNFRVDPFDTGGDGGDGDTGGPSF